MSTDAGNLLRLGTDDLLLLTAEDVPGGGSGVQTTALDAGSSTVTLAPVVVVVAFVTTGACRVRVYRSAAQRTADESRPAGTAPGVDAVVWEHIIEGAGTWFTNPSAPICRSEAVFYTLVDGAGVVEVTWQGVSS